jgi:hypothetical protein
MVRQKTQISKQHKGPQKKAVKKHTENQNEGEKETRQKSISQIKFRALNVNGLGQQKKRQTTEKVECKKR